MFVLLWRSESIMIANMRSPTVDILPTFEEPVSIRFDRGLSRPYCEPLGTLYTLDGQKRLVVSGFSPPYEAYGYSPERPGDTPIPFWGDHYIKPDHHAPKTSRPWAWMKETVNREVFLKRVSGEFVTGKLYLTRVQSFPKLICLRYHRHLVEAYEAIWALIEAMRELATEAKVVPSRWKLADDDITRIYDKARRLSGCVNHELYRSPQFLSRVLALEVRGLAPHYQPIRDKVKSFAAEMFEVIVAEFLRSYSTHQVFWSYNPPFLKGEVDLYARSESMRSVGVLIGSCKLRIANSPRPVGLEDVQNLAIRVGEAGKHERKQAQEQGNTRVSVEGLLFTNAASVDQEAIQLTNQRGIGVLQVTLPSGWLERPTGRLRVGPRDFRSLVAGEGRVVRDLFASS
jgi:hypothetical protein